jgi:hypothetical protein
MQPEWWKYIVDIAQILSAIGTCGAVVVALWIALKPPVLHAQGRVTIQEVFISGGDTVKINGKFPEYVCITLTNIGASDIKLTSLIWTFGKKAKESAYQKAEYRDELIDDVHSPLPVKLAHGEKANYFFPTFGSLDWFSRFKIGDIFDRAFKTRRSLKHLTMEAHASTGAVFRIKPDSAVLDRVWRALEETRAQATLNGNGASH